AVQVAGGALERLPHGGSALLERDEHEGLAEPLDVGVGVRDLERVRREEAMATGGATRHEAGELEGHHAITEEPHEPVHRAAEGEVAGAPAHALLERDALADLAEESRE